MIRSLVLFLSVLALPLAVLGCGPGGGVPTENVRDYHVEFQDAAASASCSEALQEEAEAHSAYTLTYRVHWIDGPDEPRVDLWWKEFGGADGDYRYFASGNQEGDLDVGVINYAGGSYEELRGEDVVTYRVEGRAPTRFNDSIPDATEEFIIEATDDDVGYPLGCAYTLSYDGNLANEQD